MGVVLHLHNPFEWRDRAVHQVRRPMTIRRFVSRRRELRQHTSVRLAAGRRARDFVQPTVCFHNGRPVLRRNWSKTVIREGDVVTFHALPAGGGNSNPLGVVLAIAIAVAVPVLGPMLGTALGFAAGSALGAAVGGAIVGLALSAVAYGIMSLFVQPPTPTSQMTGGSFGGTSAQASPTYSLQAQGNTARLGQPIPELFGRHRIYPDFAHEPYQTFSGNEQYLHYLLTLTQGELELEQVNIGETPAGNYEEIDWELVPPGGTVPTALVDPMMLVSKDIAQVELTGSEAGSPWRGPFIVNPATTEIEHLQVDYVAPEGLYYANNSGGLDARGFTLQLEVREIDDEGDPVGAGTWTLLDTIVESMATRTPQRWTRSYDLATTGRYEARMRRTDAKDTDARAGNAVQWFGLRGRQPGTRTFEGVSLLAFKARATGNLSGQSSKQVNVIGTRKLPTWDEEEGAMTEALVATRSPCDAAAYVCLAQNGARLAERQVDLAGIYAHKADYEEKGWTFDAVFDTTSTCWEALSKIGRCVVAQPIIQGPKVRLVRDLPSTAPAMMFTPRNIRKSTFELAYKFPDEKTADAVDVEYIDRRSWKQATVSVALEGSTAENPSSLQLFGCTNRGQARHVGYMFIRANRYRRRVVNFGTEMEGLLLLYGDPIRLSHDMPRWGQAAEAIAFDEGTRTLVVSHPFDFSEPGTKYVALRKRNGEIAGPFEATAVPGNPHAIVLGAGTLPPLSLGGDAERTHVAFGVGETYAKPLKVIGVKPRSMHEADIIAIDDDERMYDPIPEEE
jgi:hypothetical protein